MTFARVNNASVRNVELVLAQIDALPPPASQVAAMTDEASGDARRILGFLAADPALSARVLSILSDSCRGSMPPGTSSTSAENGLPDLAEAVRLHGGSTVGRIAWALLVMDAVAHRPSKSSRASVVPDPAALCRHALAVAFAARGIATALDGGATAVETFACGLLHDLGKAAVRAALPKSFERIVLTCERTGADIVDVERELLGIDHTGIGRHLAVRWGLPRRWVECIWLHHQSPEALPASVAEMGHVQIVQLADAMAREQRLGYSGTRGPAGSSHALAERLGLSDVDRTRIIESLPDEVDREMAIPARHHCEGAGDGRSATDSGPRQPALGNAETNERTARLERKGVYLDALHALSRGLSPHAAVREVCSAAAAAVCGALSVPASVVFVTSEDGRWVDEAFSDGRPHSASEPPLLGVSLDIRVDEATAELAAEGTWIVPLPTALGPVVDRYRGRLGEEPVWLMPIGVERRCVGGAMFSATAVRAASLRSESGELEVLAAAMGLALAQARARAEAVALGDELAEVNRRLASMQDELLRGRTLRSVVAMAAGAAHELNNPLAVISGRAQLLRQHPGGEEVRNIADAIAVQANVCSDIVTELMDFARSSEPRPQAVDLRSCVEGLAAELAAGGLLAVGQLDVDVASDTPPIWFDRSHCERLFRELLANAIEATDSADRRLTVKAVRHLTEDRVAVDVIDNGRGMTADVLSRAMDPFFSRRPAGRGRGLGLARVERWLQQGGGTIRIDSDSDRGTHVGLLFPGAPAAKG